MRPSAQAGQAIPIIQHGIHCKEPSEAAQKLCVARNEPLASSAAFERGTVQELHDHQWAACLPQFGHHALEISAVLRFIWFCGFQASARCCKLTGRRGNETYCHSANSHNLRKLMSQYISFVQASLYDKFMISHTCHITATA